MIERKLALHAECIALEENIQLEWRFRAWYRTTARELFGHRWDDLLAANNHVLRRHVRRLRRARAARGEQP